MAKNPFYKRAVEAYARAKAHADHVVESKFSTPVRNLWTASVDHVVHGLSRALRGATEVTPVVLVRAQAWVRGGLLHTARTMREAITKGTGETLADGITAAADALRYVQGHASPLDDLAIRMRVTASRHRELDRLRQESVRGMMGDVNGTLIDRMRRVAIEQGSVAELIDKVGVLADQQAWRVERLVRTETSFAYNLAQADALEELSHEHEYRDVMMRWTECVDDATQKPLDNRVGRDSLQMHGQVTRPGRLFTAPPGWMIPGSWMHPPNRPNDRSCITPWLRAWGVPAWMWQAGRQIRF